MRKLLFLTIVLIAGSFFTLPGWCEVESVPSEQPIEQQTIPSYSNGLHRDENYDPRAIVVLGYLGYKENAASRAKWPRVAFAIGDGTLLLTAAHCVDDFKVPQDEPVSINSVVISPYYGDIYNFDIVAVDNVSDIAILKVNWPAHPALALASEEELKDANSILIASRPSVEHEKPLHLVRNLHTQLLPVLKIDDVIFHSTIVLRGVGQIAPGWSGSPMIIPDSGKLTGVFGRVRAAYRKIFNLIPINTRNDACGCSIYSIKALLKKNNLEQAAFASPAKFGDIPNAEHGFNAAMNFLEALLDHNSKDLYRIAGELSKMHPDSVQVNLMFALSSVLTAHEPNVVESEHLEQAEISYNRALQLDPSNAHAHAVYADFLMLTHRNDKALEQCDAALSIDADNRLALFTKLRLLEPLETKAFAEKLLVSEPNNARIWFYYGSALHNLDENEKALQAARKTVALDPNGLFERVLGDALIGVHREDEAEPYYKIMTEKCGCQYCWYRYAQYLFRYKPEKIQEAAKALEKAESLAHMRRVSKANIIYLKLQILEKTEPNDAEALATEFLENSPDNSTYWYLYAGILRTLEKYEEAAEAAQKAVDLSKDVSFHPRLANCLAKIGEFEKAEQIYHDLHKKFPERNRYWFWYAQFLVDYFPERIGEAKAALEKASSNPHNTWYVPPGELEKLREKIEEITEPAIIYID